MHISLQPDTPNWPSLYDPAIDLLHIQHKEAVQPGGAYLTNANDIFRFTFYWTLVFYLPLFVLCGFLAFLNIAFAPSSRRGSLAHQSKTSLAYFPLKIRKSGSGTGGSGDDGNEDGSLDGHGLGLRARRKRSRSTRDREHDHPFNADAHEHEYEHEHEHEHEHELNNEAYPLAQTSTFHSGSGASPTSATPLHPRARTSMSSSAAGIYPPTTRHRLYAGAGAYFPTFRGGSTEGVDVYANEEGGGRAANVDSEGALSVSHRTPPRTNPHRTRATFAILILFTYLVSGLLGAVLSAAILGYVLAGVYSAGNFNMSTWIPPIFALVQTLVGILGLYPSIIEII